MKNNKITNIKGTAMRNRSNLAFLQTALMSFLVIGAVSVAGAQEEVAADKGVSNNTAVTEVVARQGAVEISKEAAFAAQEYMVQGDYEKAVDKYLLVINTLSSADATQIPAESVKSDLELAKRNLAECYRKWAEQLYFEAQNAATTGAYDEAIDKCVKAAEVYPPYKDTLDELVTRYSSMKKAKDFKLENADLNKIDPNAENRAYRISVRLEKGKNLYKLKRYDKALEEFNAVITLDPYNMTAIEYQSKIFRDLIQEGRARRQLSAVERVTEVAWNALSPITADSSFGEENMEYIATKYDRINKDIQKKLDEIIIDHLSYTDEPITMVIEDLRKKSRENDLSEQTGVNFIFRDEVPDYQGLYGTKIDENSRRGGAGFPDAPGAPGAPQGADPMAAVRNNRQTIAAGGVNPRDPDVILQQQGGGGNPADPMAQFRNRGNVNANQNVGQQIAGVDDQMIGLEGEEPLIEETNDYPITVELENVTLGEAIGYICRSANLNYKIEENAVIIATPMVSLDDLETSVFPIEKEALNLLGEDVSGDAVIGYFLDRGVPFPQGAKCAFDEGISRLIVTNTQKNLDLVAEIINQMNVADPQVLMLVKFVEVDANDIQELGFEYSFSRTTAGPDLNNVSAEDGELLDSTLGKYYHVVQTTDNGTKFIYESDRQFGIFSESFQKVDNSDEWNYVTSEVQTIKKGSFFEMPDNAISGTTGTKYYQIDLPENKHAITWGANSPLVRNVKDNPTAFNQDAVVSDTFLDWGHTSSKGYSWNAKIHMLDQADSSEILSTPRLLAMNGEQATIRMVTEKYYPDDWEEPELEVTGNNGDNNSGWIVFTPSKPNMGDAKEEGVVLQVRPMVDDNFAITLSLAPTIQTMVGWTDYSYDIPLTVDNATAYFPNVLKMPIMEVRKLETTVTSYDGQTVVLGGIIKDTISSVEDQYPILGDIPLVGRLFQSKGRGSKKINLLIFLTSTLVNPDGTPLRENDAHGLPNIK